MRDVTDRTFDDEVLRARTPVVVDFWAPWCGPCKAVEPVLEALERDHPGRVAFVRVDVDANPIAAARYGVLSLPTTMLFADGSERAVVRGARTREHYERVFNLT